MKGGGCSANFRNLRGGGPKKLMLENKSAKDLVKYNWDTDPIAESSSGSNKNSSKKPSLLRLKDRPLHKKTVKRSKRTMRKQGRRPKSANKMRRGKRRGSISIKSTMSKPATKKKTKKKTKTKKKGKKKMNAYMIALQKARKANAPSFTYNGTTYYQKHTKTGMVIYGKKK